MICIDRAWLASAALTAGLAPLSELAIAAQERWAAVPPSLRQGVVAQPFQARFRVCLGAGIAVRADAPAAGRFRPVSLAVKVEPVRVVDSHPAPPGDVDMYRDGSVVLNGLAGTMLIARFEGCLRRFGQQL